jgi:hypothetical protein
MMFLDTAVLDVRSGHVDSRTKYDRVFVAARQQLRRP